MRPVLSRQQSRELDRRAMEGGVPGVVLMENAGRGATDVVIDELRGRGTALESARVVVLLGAGNNGGDGLVVARLLRSRGVRVRVLGMVDPAELRGDAAANWQALQAMGGSVETPPAASADETAATVGAWVAKAVRECDVVVDALLGTGVTREVEGKFAAAITALNAVTSEPMPPVTNGRFARESSMFEASPSEPPPPPRQAPSVVALDLPSGLDCDTGATHGACVRATRTVTFAHEKLGHFGTAGHLHSGKLEVRHIGIPERVDGQVSAAAYLLERPDLAERLERRPPTAHKGTAGRVVIVAGGRGRLGAARLCALSALRGGAGLVTVATHRDAADVLDQTTLEVMTAGFDVASSDERQGLTKLLRGADAIGVGPGLGRNEAALTFFQTVAASGTPLVIDADALHLFGQVRNEGGVEFAAGTVWTPHPGEAGALLGKRPAEIEADRFSAVRALVELTGGVVVLKGSQTLVGAPDQAPVICPFGSSVLATAGAGDVLTGLIAALLAEYAPYEAALLGVGIHALAGERWSDEGRRDRGLLAHEITEQFPDVVADLLAVP